MKLLSSTRAAPADRPRTAQMAEVQPPRPTGTTPPRRAPAPVLDTSRPVMVIDGGSRADLGLVRSLGMAGIDVHLLTSLRSSVTGESRHVTQTHAFLQFDADDFERVARMRAIARSLPERPIVMASGDRALRFLSRSRATFEDVIDHDLAPAAVIDACLDKARFAKVASTQNFPVPRSWAPPNIAGAEALASELDYPVFLKPIRTEPSAAVFSGIGVPGKGWRIRNAAALKERCRTLEAAGIRRVLIQEYIPGPDSGLVSVHVYVDRAGRVAGTFSGQKLRCFPPDAGVGTHVVSLRDEPLIATSTWILSQLKYTGFAILQYKRDERDGAMKLLEVNCRYGTWTELPSRAGCNFPVAAYAAITRQRLPGLVQRDGMAWLDLARDFEAFAVHRENGSCTWMQYLRSLAPVRCWAFFAADDPAPFFWQLLRRGAS